MYYNTQIEDFEIPPYIHTDHLFTKDEIKQISEYCDKLQLEDGKIFTGAGAPYRDCSIAYGNYKEEDKWIFDLMSRAVHDVNVNFFNFHLVGFNFFQYAVYQGSGNHYDFHMDSRYATPISFSASPYGARKLSFSLVLSDNSEYEGGEFEIQTSKQPNSIVPQSKGMLIAFPSFISHRVRPVTSGTRKSIVFWVCGPRFK